MPESQRSRKQWQKATDMEKHMCVCTTHSSTAIHLTIAAEIPTQSTHLPQINRKETSPLSTSPFSHFCPHDQKKKKNPRQANITFKAAVAMIFSLQRQDLLFWSLRQEGLITAPHQHCRQKSSRLWDSLLAPTLIPQRVAGMGRHSTFASFKMASAGSEFSVSLENFWSQCQAGLNTRWGLGIRVSASRLPTTGNYWPPEIFFLT